MKEATVLYRQGRQHRWLIFILIAYVLLGLTYSIVTPLAETPDESEHYRYLQTIADRGQLPIMVPEYDENVTIEAHQPPLLYLTGAALTGWLGLHEADIPPENPCFSFLPDDSGRQHVYLHSPSEWPPQTGVARSFMIMRWLSVLMGAVTIVLAYQLGQQVYPADKRLALASAAILAFNPQFIFITASLNNDVPSLMFGAAMLTVMITAVSNPTPLRFAFLGILTGLGLLTKFALLAFWPLALLATGWPIVCYLGAQVKPTWFGNRTVSDIRWSSLAIHVGLVAGLPLLIAGWWYWRNYQLYGDPLMWEITLAAKGAVIARHGSLTLADLWEFVWLHFESYWLWFGWLNVKAPPGVYAVIALGVITAVFGLVRLLWRRHLAVNWLALGVCALAVLMIYLSLFNYIRTINWTGYQGRLAFAAAAPIAVLLALGLWSVAGVRVAQSASSGLLVLSVLAVPLLLMPAYPRPEIYLPAGAVQRTCARFESGLQVEGVAVPSHTQPGDTITAVLYGFGLADSAEAETAVLQLRGFANEVLAESSTPISWEKGEVISATIHLPVPETTQPARGNVTIGLRDAVGNWQAATSATGRVLDMPISAAAIKMAPERPLLPQPQVETAVHFGDELLLIGYDLEQENDVLQLTLYWQALAPMTRDYTTFVHVLAADNHVPAQQDSQPHGGAYPTSIWDAHEIVADTKQVSLMEWGENTRLVVGAYDLETLTRLPVFDEQGTQYQHDQYPLVFP